MAAKLKLRLNIINLSQPGLTDDLLGTSFSELTRGGIVLLEDVDCAGCSIDREAQGEESSQESDSSMDDRLSSESASGDTDDEAGKERRSKTNASNRESKSKRKREQRERSRERSSSKGRCKRTSSKTIKPQDTPIQTSGVTLSGLLNAIDGICSEPNGHILIMTTNHKDKIDEALLRPGRADMEVEFPLATTEQARQLFKFTYKPPACQKTPKYDVDMISTWAEEFANRFRTSRCHAPNSRHMSFNIRHSQPRLSKMLVLGYRRSQVGRQR